MNSPFQTDPNRRDSLEDDLDQQRRDREISLGTSTILGAFFALALVCALFFGFGYTMGRKSVPSAAAAQEASNATFGSFKPAPGSPAIQAVPGYLSAKDAAAANASATTQVYAPAASAPAPVGNGAGGTGATRAGAAAAVNRAPTPPASSTKAEQAEPEAAIIPVEPPRQPVRTAPAPAPAPAPVPVASASAPAMVQIAAVSHKEDADVLLAALKRKGYNVAVHQEGQDKLLHVQIGPFPTKKDAEAMRQKLLADGYNAIVK